MIIVNYTAQNQDNKCFIDVDIRTDLLEIMLYMQITALLRLHYVCKVLSWACIMDKVMQRAAGAVLHIEFTFTSPTLTCYSFGNGEIIVTNVAITAYDTVTAAAVAAESFAVVWICSATVTSVTKSSVAVWTLLLCCQ